MESICRVETLSLSGHILLHLSDYFIVQWPTLKEKYPKTVYLGRIVWQSTACIFRMLPSTMVFTLMVGGNTTGFPWRLLKIENYWWSRVTKQEVQITECRETEISRKPTWWAVNTKHLRLYTPDFISRKVSVTNYKLSSVYTIFFRPKYKVCMMSNISCYYSFLPPPQVPAFWGGGERKEKYFFLMLWIHQALFPAGSSAVPSEPLQPKGSSYVKLASWQLAFHRLPEPKHKPVSLSLSAPSPFFCLFFSLVLWVIGFNPECLVKSLV